MPSLSWRPPALLLFLTLAALAGCAASNSSKLIVESRPDLPPQLGTAPTDGQYALYVSGAVQPLATYQLKLGERLGFEPLEGGSVGGLEVNYLYAVAGANVIRLDAQRSYQWRRP